VGCDTYDARDDHRQVSSRCTHMPTPSRLHMQTARQWRGLELLRRSRGPQGTWHIRVLARRVPCAL